MGGIIDNANPTRLETKLDGNTAFVTPLGQFAALSPSLEQSEFSNQEQQPHAGYCIPTYCNKGDCSDLQHPDVDAGAWMVVGDDDAGGGKMKHEAPVQAVVDNAIHAATGHANSVLSCHNTSPFSQSATAKTPTARLFQEVRRCTQAPLSLLEN